MVPTVFLCYHREDNKIVDKLKKHLIGSLVNTKRIVLLEEDITTGAEWEKEINKYLHESQIILLAISSSFSEGFGGLVSDLFDEPGYFGVDGYLYLLFHEGHTALAAGGFGSDADVAQGKT